LAPRTEVDVDVVGYKYHMNNVTATLGLVQLEHVRAVVDRHIENGRFFDAALQGIPGLTVPSFDAEAEPSYWLYTVLAERRDDLARALTDRGIGNSMCHKRNDLHSVFTSSRCHLPGLDSYFSKMLHIPCGWWVSDEDRETIVDVLKKGW
jgi:dTDP-4-amino-4,6-dideoxygalactose transaminase